MSISDEMEIKMKAVILAGGWPSSLTDYGDSKIPKPMAEIGGRPLLWHIMKNFASYGVEDFIICTGYNGKSIKDYFKDYYIYQSDITVDLESNKIEIHRKETETWNVSIIDTGINTGAVERIWYVQEQLEETFVVTYGDCLSDIDLSKMLAYHYTNGKVATVAVTKPAGRNKLLSLDRKGEFLDSSFSYNNQYAWTNAGLMIFTPKIFDYIEKSDSYMEEGIFDRLAKVKEICAYKHNGYWIPVETKRDHANLEVLWSEGKAPWKIW